MSKSRVVLMGPHFAPVVVMTFQTSYKLNILTGLNCNLRCSHCINSSGPNRKETLSNNDILNINSAIEQYEFNEIMFTGGEPTLNLESIKLINFEKNSLAETSITSNGWFLKNEESILHVLNEIPKIKTFYFSMDKFRPRLSFRVLTDALAIFRRYNKKVGFRVTIAEPEEIADWVEFLGKFDTPIFYQKASLSGRAKKYSISYNYIQFDPNVLDSKCPNQGIFNFIPGKGFTTCCGNLAFDLDMKSIFSDDLTSHMRSPFFSDISKATFRQLGAKFGADLNGLPPEASDPCVLCERILAGKYG